MSVESLRLTGIDVAGTKLKKSSDLRFLDILVHLPKAQLGQRLLVCDDFNASRLLDKLLERGNNEFFDRIRDEGFVSIRRRFHSADEQTYFNGGEGGTSSTIRYADAPVAAFASACVVLRHTEVAEFSDRGAVIADFEL